MVPRAVVTRRCRSGNGHRIASPATICFSIAATVSRSVAGGATTEYGAASVRVTNAEGRRGVILANRQSRRYSVPSDAMNDVTTKNFGLLIAYILPGFTALVGMSYLAEPVRIWLGTTPSNLPTVGGFLYVTVGSIGAGLIASTVRWLILDTVHHWTGVRRGNWDFAQLQSNATAFDVLGENHYRYYQFYGNTAVALPFWYVAKWVATGTRFPPLGYGSLVVASIELLLLAGSRDTLQKYYDRVSVVLRANSRPPATSTARSAGHESTIGFLPGSRTPRV